MIAYDAVISDVTERERARIGLQLAREEAERRSRVDPTTGLFNRHHLLDVARRELARSQREHTSPALVLLDVDRLRELNEHRGHAVGDAVLRELAGRLSHSVRTYDTISHVGGGRFAVLVPDLRDGEALRRICDEIAATLTTEPLRSAGREVRVTVSAGGARSHPGTTVDALLHTAEVALAAAKRNGPGQAGRQGQPPGAAGGRDRRGSARRGHAGPRRRGARGRARTSTSVSVAELAELVGRELGLPESLQARSAPGRAAARRRHDRRRRRRALQARAARRGGVGDAARAPEHRRRHGRPHPRPRAHAARDPPPPRALRRRRAIPTGSRASRFPVAARVLAAVDAYTAMTEIRPYRDARDRDEALEELRRNAGTQLDPTVVDALCRVLAGENAPQSRPRSA